MELQGATLPEPQQGRQVVAEDVAVLLVLVIREDVHSRDEVRQRLLPMLLIEAFPVDALWHTDHGQWPVLQMRQHEWRDACQIADEIALGDLRSPQARLGRPVDAIEA